nr:reverse transcriptase domain-containing protein [Tanacetum cinerariifolium]
MDDEPIWAADHVVALTSGSTITIPETANEFAIKGNAQKLPWSQSVQRQYYKNLLSWSKRDNPRSSECHCWCNYDPAKIMARMDAMTLKMDAKYKELQSNAKKAKPDLDEDDIPILADKQSGRPSGSLPSNTQPNPKGHNSKTYQPPQARNEHVNVVFTRSGKSYNPPVNPNDQQDKSETPISFDSDNEDDETAPQPKFKIQNQELISNKHKIEHISAAFLSDESLALIQNKVPPKLGDPGSFLIPCNFNKVFSCNALADLGASINLMPYSLYAKLSLKTLKPTKMSIRLADRSFQYPVGIAKNMLVEVGKFRFPVDFVILKMEEDSKFPLILGRPFLHTANAVI